MPLLPRSAFRLPGFLLALFVAMSAFAQDSAPIPSPVTKGQRVYTTGHSFHAWTAASKHPMSGVAAAP